MEEMKRKYTTKVCCYDLKGKLVMRFDTAIEASSYFAVHKRRVDKCLRGESRSVKGHMFRRYQQDEIPLKIEPYQNKIVRESNTPIKKVDEKGEIIEVYRSINEASIANHTDSRSIRDVISNKYQYAHGYRYIKLSEEEIKKYGFKSSKRETYKTIKVKQYSLDGEYIKTYDSITEAAKENNIKRQSIEACLKRKQKSAGKYKWRKR